MQQASKINPINIGAVEEYYDKSQKWYSWFYSDKESLALHYGFWDKNTKSRKESLLNQYREINHILQINSNDLVLDVGCGVGGASLWLSKNTGAEFTGITLSSVQLKLAQHHAARLELSNKVVFYKKNYFSTGFEDEKFHKIFAIESFCHSYPRIDLALAEMKRILKPKGKIVMSDGVFLRKPKNEYEKKLAEDLMLGFKLDGWQTYKEIISSFEKCGFRNIRFYDKTKAIGKSVQDIYFRGKMLSPIKFLGHLGIVSKVEAENLLATNAQKKLYDLGLFGHGVFYAEK